MDKEENRNTESKTDSERKQCQEASVGKKKARYGRFRVTFSTNHTTLKRQKIDTHKAGKINRKLLKKQSRYMKKKFNRQYTDYLVYIADADLNIDIKALSLGLNMHMKITIFFKIV